MVFFEKMFLSFRAKLKFAPTAFFILSLLIAQIGCGAFVSQTALYPKFFEGDAAQAAANAVKAKFGEKARVLAIEIGKDFILKIQDAENPRNVDAYKYAAGFFIKTGAVRLDGLERNLKNTLFDFAEIDLTRVSSLGAEINERARLENGRIRRIEIRRALDLSGDFQNSGAVRWQIEFGSERETVTAFADANGRLRGVDLSHTARADEFDLNEPLEFARMLDAVRENFGADESVTEITLDEKRLFIKKPKPGNDAESNYEYVYDISGLREKPSAFPAQSSASEQFEFGEINLADAPRLGKRALAELGAPPEAYVSNIRIFRVSDFGKNHRTIWEIWVKPYRNSPKSGFVQFDTKLNLFRTAKW